MKKRLYIAALAIAAIATLPSCEDFLNPESKTDGKSSVSCPLKPSDSAPLC